MGEQVKIFQNQAHHEAMLILFWQKEEKHFDLSFPGNGRGFCVNETENAVLEKPTTFLPIYVPRILGGCAAVGRMQDAACRFPSQVIQNNYGFVKIELSTRYLLSRQIDKDCLTKFLENWNPTILCLC